MRKKLIKIVTVLLSVVIFSLPVGSSFSAASPEIVSVAKEAPQAEKINEARFLNMLNHNYVYNESYDSLESIVNDSVIALLDMRESENDSYISEEIVNGYLFDMFGFEIDDFSLLNTQFPKKEGYVFILPRGYAKYEHSAVSITENEDGTLTFITDVTISTHDGMNETLKCKTMFIENTDSVFGYNIVRSDILDNISSI